MLIDFNNLKINNLDFETDFEKKINFFLEEWFSDSRTLKVQTSGSTGTPKVFEIEKKRMIADNLCMRSGQKKSDCSSAAVVIYLL